LLLNLPALFFSCGSHGGTLLLLLLGKLLGLVGFEVPPVDARNGGWRELERVQTAELLQQLVGGDVGQELVLVGDGGHFLAGGRVEEELERHPRGTEPWACWIDLIQPRRRRKNNKSRARKEQRDVTVKAV
jgi:hypothetical protein